MSQKNLGNIAEVEGVLSKFCNLTFRINETRGESSPYFYRERLHLTATLTPKISKSGRFKTAFCNYFHVEDDEKAVFEKFCEIFKFAFLEVYADTDVAMFEEKKILGFNCHPRRVSPKPISHHVKSGENGEESISRALEITNVEFSITQKQKQNVHKYLNVVLYLPFSQYKAYVHSTHANLPDPKINKNHLLPAAISFKSIEIEPSMLKVQHRTHLRNVKNNLVQFVVKNLSSYLSVDLNSVKVHLIQSSKILGPKKERKKAQKLFDRYLVKEYNSCYQFPIKIKSGESVSLVFEIEYLGVPEYDTRTESIMSVHELSKISGVDLSDMKFVDKTSPPEKKKPKKKRKKKFSKSDKNVKKNSDPEDVYQKFQTLCSFSYSIENVVAPIDDYHVVQWKGIIERDLVVSMELDTFGGKNSDGVIRRGEVFTMSCFLWNMSSREYAFSVNYGKRSASLVCRDKKLEIDLKGNECKRFKLNFVGLKEGVRIIEKIIFFDKLKNVKYILPFEVPVYIAPSESVDGMDPENHNVDEYDKSEDQSGKDEDITETDEISTEVPDDDEDEVEDDNNNDAEDEPEEVEEEGEVDVSLLGSSGTDDQEKRSPSEDDNLVTEKNESKEETQQKNTIVT